MQMLLGGSIRNRSGRNLCQKLREDGYEVGFQILQMTDKTVTAEEDEIVRISQIQTQYILTRTGLKDP